MFFLGYSSSANGVCLLMVYTFQIRSYIKEPRQFLWSQDFGDSVGTPAVHDKAHLLSKIPSREYEC